MNTHHTQWNLRCTTAVNAPPAIFKVGRHLDAPKFFIFSKAKRGIDTMS